MSIGVQRREARQIIRHKMFDVIKEGIVNFTFIQETRRMKGLSDMELLGKRISYLTGLRNKFIKDKDKPSIDVNTIAKTISIPWCTILGVDGIERFGSPTGMRDLGEVAVANVQLLNDNPVGYIGMIVIYAEGQHKLSHKLVDHIRGRMGLEQAAKELRAIEDLTRKRLEAFVLDFYQNANISEDLNKTKSKGY